ncbi:MAG: hypothetical protein NC332_02575 [Firmicutes bacterium]|nr:hypothetical protein [Bacillota bacterium]
MSHFVKKPFKNIKLMKAIDKVLGMVLGVVISYAVVAVFVAFFNRTGEDFFPQLKEIVDEQLANSVIIKTVYANNFFGDWIIDIIYKTVSAVI